MVADVPIRGRRRGSRPDPQEAFATAGHHRRVAGRRVQAVERPARVGEPLVEEPGHREQPHVTVDRDELRLREPGVRAGAARHPERVPLLPDTDGLCRRHVVPRVVGTGRRRPLRPGVREVPPLAASRVLAVDVESVTLAAVEPGGVCLGGTRAVRHACGAVAGWVLERRRGGRGAVGTGGRRARCVRGLSRPGCRPGRTGTPRDDDTEHERHDVERAHVVRRPEGGVESF